MTKAPTPRRRKEARPAEIMAAGLTAFAERGFAATRLEDVARAAGVSKATIYLYFDSKAALLKAILIDIVTPRMGEIESILKAHDGPALDLLRLFFDRASATINTPNVRAILKLILSEARNFPDITEFYRKEVAFRGLYSIAHIIERGIERGEFRRCDPVTTAQSIIFPLLMNAIATEVFGSMPEFDQKKFIPSHLDFVLRGLAANGEA
jgi:AcrR family transcriptional regulator